MTSDFSFDNIISPYDGVTLYRFKHSLTSQGSTFWCENKTTHQQWKGTIEDISSYGPEGVKLPKEAVLSYLQSAFEQNDQEFALQTSLKRKAADENCYLDFKEYEDQLEITLKAKISKVYTAVYEFCLFHIELDKVDVLSAQLKEANEVIAELKKKQDNCFHYLSVGGLNVNENQQISWSCEEHRYIDQSHFCLENNSSDIIVKVGGLYQVTIRVTGVTNSRCTTMVVTLKANEVDKSFCCQTISSDDDHGGSNHYGTITIYEVLELPANSKLQVLCNGDFVNVHPKSSRAIIQLLAPRL